MVNDTHGRPKLERPICREIIVEQYIYSTDVLGQIKDSVYRLFSTDCEFSTTYSRKTEACETCSQCKKSHLQFLRRFQTWADREATKETLSKTKEQDEPDEKIQRDPALDRLPEETEKRGMEMDETEDMDEPGSSRLAWIKQQIAIRREELNLDEGARLQAFLNSPNKGQVVIEKFSIDMTVDKLSCLCNRTWLNDEVLNFYMCLLQARSDRHVQCSKEDPSYRPFQTRSSHYFNSFFMAKVLETGIYQYASVKRWTKKFDIFEKEKIYFPINIGNAHWTLLVLFVQLRQIHYYDSMDGRGKKYLDTILQWVVDEGKEKKEIVVDTSDWLLVEHYSVEKVKQILAANGNEEFFRANYSKFGQRHYVPQQNNGFDCGMFVCMNCDFITDDVPLLDAFTQQDMEHFRRKIGTDIIRGNIKY